MSKEIVCDICYSIIDEPKHYQFKKYDRWNNGEYTWLGLARFDMCKDCYNKMVEFITKQVTEDL